jgi:hypothetical protein
LILPEPLDGRRFGKPYPVLVIPLTREVVEKLVATVGSETYFPGFDASGDACAPLGKEMAREALASIGIQAVPRRKRKS